MAEKKSDRNKFPQIPTTVWWGVREILGRTPTAVLNERFLAIHLNVQEAAAKQYIAELISVGILDDEKKATPLALEWRLDSSYRDAVEKLLKNVYPQALLDLAPHDEGDRQRATSYFMQEGLGQGAAGNKAATYFLIGAGQPGDSPVRNAGKTKSSDGAVGSSADQRKTVQKRVPPQAREENVQRRDSTPMDGMPLNVNVQIHIGADASSDQIEAIFSAMKRYLNDTQTR